MMATCWHGNWNFNGCKQQGNLSYWPAWTKAAYSQKSCSACCRNLHVYCGQSWCFCLKKWLKEKIQMYKYCRLITSKQWLFMWKITTQTRNSFSHENKYMCVCAYVQEKLLQYKQCKASEKWMKHCLPGIIYSNPWILNLLYC